MLTIELVPKTAWFKNLRSELPRMQWDKLRKATYSAAGNHCEVCGGKGPKWPVECHEIWIYDDIKHTQTLTGLIALCPSCHQVKHMGLARIRGKEEEATQHLMKVNHFNRYEANSFIEKAFILWEERGKNNWKINYEWVNTVL